VEVINTKSTGAVDGNRILLLQRLLCRKLEVTGKISP